MLYVGLDVHQKRSSMCILNNDGKPVKQELIKGPWPKLLERLEQIREPFSVCYEASCGYGHLHDRIAPLPRGQPRVGGPPGPVAADLQEQEEARPRRRGEDRQAAVPRSTRCRAYTCRT